jgi:hypothetical protein
MSQAPSRQPNDGVWVAIVEAGLIVAIRVDVQTAIHSDRFGELPKRSRNSEEAVVFLRVIDAAATQTNIDRGQKVPDTPGAPATAFHSDSNQDVVRPSRNAPVR